jgi:hypothetical protein
MPRKKPHWKWLDLAKRAAEIQHAQGNGNGAITAILDGVGGPGGSHITFDALAPVAYVQTGDMWWILIHKGTDSATRFANIGNNGGSNTWLSRTSASNLTINSNPGGLLSSTLNPVDDVWNVVQCMDLYDDVSKGTLYGKVNGIARQNSTAYTRYATSANFPKWVTIGALRNGAAATVSLNSAGRDAYLALLTGCRPSDVQQGQVWTAFDTGGGRSNLQAVTDALNSLATTLGGVVQWAGPLDNLGSPHEDNGPYGNPTFLNCTFEDAGF